MWMRKWQSISLVLLVLGSGVVSISTSVLAADVKTGILEVFVDKEGHVQGEETVVVVEWRAASQSILSRTDKNKNSGKSQPISANMTMVGSDGQLCAEPVFMTLFMEDTHVRIATLLSKDCQAYEIRVSLIDKGSVLDTAVLSVVQADTAQAVVAPSEILPEQEQSTEVSADISGRFPIRIIGFAIGGGFLFMGLVAIFFYRRCGTSVHSPKRFSGMIKTLLVLILVSAGISVSSGVTLAAVGVCGPAAGVTSASAPSENLCSAGAASHVYDYGFWWWRCEGTGGDAAASCSAGKSVAAPRLTFLSNDTEILSGGSVVLRWMTSGSVDRCVASGAWSGDKSSNGSESIDNLTADSTFYLSCSGPNGSTGEHVVTVSVVPHPHGMQPEDPAVSGPGSGIAGEEYTFSATAIDPNDADVEFKIDWDHDGQYNEVAGSASAAGPWVPSGGSKSFSHTWSASGSYTFGVATRNNNGVWSNWTDYTVVISTEVVTPPVPAAPSAPTVDFTINGSTGPLSLARGASETMAWSVTNADSCVAFSNDNWSGSKPVGLNNSSNQLSHATSDFTLSCTGPGDTTSKIVHVYVTCPTPSETKSDGSCVCDTEKKDHYEWSPALCDWVTGSRIDCATEEKNACRDFNWKEVAS
jgi:hypothetical protein